jgi:hypothetical protein
MFRAQNINIIKVMCESVVRMSEKERERESESERARARERERESESESERAREKGYRFLSKGFPTKSW